MHHAPGVGRGLALAGRIGVGALLCSAPAGAALVLNEVLIDPDGADSGREFVEILNTGPGVESLDGVQFQFANGTEGPVWKTRWTGAADEVLDPGERYLIVDRNWLGEPPGRAEVYLGLQNGPDAVRLARDSVALDLVGYGPLTDPQMREGEPAPVTTGRSLARRPDGRDTGDNAADLVAAEPTPGAPNFQPWAVAPVGWTADPPAVDRTGCEVRFEIALRNVGTNGIPPSSLEFLCGAQRQPARLPQWEPDQEHTLTWLVRPMLPGPQQLAVVVLPPAVPDTVRVTLGRFQVGPGDLVISEVLAAPGRDQGEWIELCAVADSVRLGDYFVRDEDGPPRALPDLTLAANDLFVLAEDSLALEAWFTENRLHGLVAGCEAEAARIGAPAGAWPSLNNTASSVRDFADRVRLLDAGGLVIDQVAWGDAGSGVVPAPGSDRSLERIAIRVATAAGNPAANWAPSAAPPGSTPGCPNSLTGPEVENLEVLIDPRVLDPARGVAALHVRFAVESPASGAVVRIYDLGGARIRDLGADGLGAGRRDLIWDGRDDAGFPVAPGAYIVLVRLATADGSILSRRKALVAVRGPGS